MISTRPITVSTPLGKDVLLVHRMTATDELGRLSRYDLELLSHDSRIKLEDLLGQGITVELELPDGGARCFHGLVARFSQTGRIGRFTQYAATLRPWLWLLTRTRDCRIFPDASEARAKTVPEIIKDVFRKNGFSDFKERLSGTYKPREYCVQYRESDFDFVSRLMEEEGIYYYLQHEDGKHTVVLADASNSHDPIPGCERVPFMAASTDSAARVDHVSQWLLAHEIQSGVYALNDSDFEVPRADLEVKSSIPRRHAHSKLEVYDPPGRYVGAYGASGGGDSGDPDAMERGQSFARARIEELHSDYEQIQGSGNVRGLAAGGTFKLTDFHRDDQNREYLVVSTSHRVQIAGYEGLGEESAETAFLCDFTAIPAKTPFRPKRITPKPLISGPQTATVVGKSGEEIWTDAHGRVKVQFHWDRRAAKDETSSCWVRVSHPWAGKNWGSVHIPRIGHEVIVEFLEGDPDRPIITGSVYNGQNKTPYTLPDHQTQSGIKSRSTKQGTGENFNEIRFEDKKGEEQLFIHAEKNHVIEVENDETHSVGHDRKKTIGNDETTEVKKNRTETVGAEEKITIGANRTESVAKNETISVGGSRSQSIAKDETVSVEGGRNETVAKDESLNVTGARTHSIGKDETVTIGKDHRLTIADNRTQQVGKNESLTVAENRNQSVGKNDSLDVGKKLVIQAGDEISFETGSAKIVLKKNGDIQIEGSNITVKGSGNVTLKGSKIAQN